MEGLSPILVIIVSCFMYPSGIASFGSEGIVVLCLSTCFYHPGSCIQELNIFAHVGKHRLNSIL